MAQQVVSSAAANEQPTLSCQAERKSGALAEQLHQVQQQQQRGQHLDVESPSSTSSTSSAPKSSQRETNNNEPIKPTAAMQQQQQSPGEQQLAHKKKKNRKLRSQGNINDDQQSTSSPTDNGSGVALEANSVIANSSKTQSSQDKAQEIVENVVAAAKPNLPAHSLTLTGNAAPAAAAPHTVIECATGNAAPVPVPDQQNQVSTGSVKSDSKKSTPDECQLTLDTSVQNCSSIALLPLDDSSINNSPVSAAAAGNQQQQQTRTTDNNHQSLTQDTNKSEDSKQQQQRKSGNSNKRPSVLFEGQETATTATPTNLCKQRRLSYLQSLLLRRWPCLAIGICIMSSLLFGMLLSVLTVYLMHSVTDCSNLALAAAASANAAGNVNSPLLSPHELRRLNLDLEGSNPFEMAASLTVGRDSEIFSARSQSGNSGGISSAGNQLQVSSTSHRFQRLPNSLWPIHYDLFVQPYIAEPFNFSGKVSIRIKCSEATDNITLHTLDLELDEKSLSLKLAAQNTNSSSSSNQQVKVASASASAAAPKVKGLSQDKQLQYSIIHLDSPLQVGFEYVLGIDFSGLLNDDLAGFYKIRFERQNSSETTWIAATQFQATDARRAFPCFDEPLYKATFSIQIKHWKNMTALSNMPIIDRQDSPDGLWVTDTFSKSHRMSTYLVAYAITNFESRSEGNISVWTRPGFAHSAEYALKIAGKILRHYEDFFGIEYPLPKMDMIALPDFNAGAMENWGLITYRETAMLWDENSSSVGNKQRVAVVVAHELAHQWFGNLVTPKWWDDLWLNEGFASYVEYIGVDHVEPTWRMLDQFVVEEVQNVFKLDGLSSSHQISIPVNNPDEISEIFDHISYAKGASIIRMMNHFLTEQVFKAGLRRYLSALRYSNAEQSDLWAHLTEAYQQLGANKRGTGVEPINVERVMNSWTLQVGFPLVTLTRSYGQSRKALLEQHRYQPYKTQLALNSATTLINSTTTTNNQEISSKLTSGTSSGSQQQQQQHHKQQQRWEIPITFTSKSEQNWQPNTRLWMHQNDSQPVEINKDLIPNSDDDWMLLNVNQVGYYRVNYDLRNWRLLINQLNSDHNKISTTNRAQILDDIFELARTGLIDYVFAMEATKYLKIEREYLPWDTVLMSFSYIDDMLQRTPLYGDWKDYIADLISPYYARYRDTDWTMGSNKVNTEQQLNNQSSSSVTSPTSVASNNDVLEQYNQVNAIHWACQVNEHCIQKAKSNFYQWKKTGRNHIEPALRYTVYCSAIENGNKEDWDFLWKIYEAEQNAQERDRIMRALGCTREIWLLSRYLDWTFSKTKAIRRQDGAYVFKMIAKNNYGRDVAFNFMRERWSTIKEYYGKSSFSLGNLIRSIATSMNTQVELSQLIAFYESIKGDVGTGKRAFQIAMEEAESNVLWRNRNYKILEEWIHDARGGKTTAKMAIK